MRTAMQLKALIRNMAKEKNINPQIILRIYMFERLLERISLSKYKGNFILKGGMLIAAIIGIDLRSTMDIDATLTGTNLSISAANKMFNEILSIDVDDNVSMSLKSIDNIHKDDKYGGLRVSIEALFDKIIQPLKVDITTGEKITPKALNYEFKLLFEERSIEILTYTIETILAEKLETIISRSTANTRMRDFYDIHILYSLERANINDDILVNSIQTTTTYRKTNVLLKDANKTFTEIYNDEVMKEQWERYRAKNNFAKDINWNDIYNSILKLWNIYKI